MIYVCLVISAVNYFMCVRSGDAELKSIYILVMTICFVGLEIIREIRKGRLKK